MKNKGELQSLSRTMYFLVVLASADLIFILRYIYISFCVNFQGWKNQLLTRANWRLKEFKANADTFVEKN